MVGFSFNPLLSQIGRTLHHLSVWRNSAVGKSKVTIFTVKLYKTRPIRIITIDCTKVILWYENRCSLLFHIDATMQETLQNACSSTIFNATKAVLKYGYNISRGFFALPGRRYRASSCQFTFFHIDLYFISSERALYSVYVRGNLSVARFCENIVLSERNIIESLESLCVYI